MSTSPPTAECDVSVILVNYNTAHLPVSYTHLTLPTN